MSTTVPSNSLQILLRASKETIPKARQHLKDWKEVGNQIPDQEIREQATWTISDKTFHCEGGSILGFLAGENQDAYIKFMVAYQSICDYLDTLCDKNDRHNQDDFRSIHHALLDSLSPGEPFSDYYEHRQPFDDGGYLKKLVTTCRETIKTFPGFVTMQEDMKEVSQFYIDFQVYKHVEKSLREPLLMHFYETNKHLAPSMRWYEFACGTASTLGLYCLAAYAAKDVRTKEESKQIKEAYFPWLQGLHIMLDYFIDQEEDRAEDEMNFTSYYESRDDLVNRVQLLDQEATSRLKKLPDASFHLLIKRGLYAIYLADSKVKANPRMQKDAKVLLKLGGMPAKFFYYNKWMFKRKT
ncbi:tetraprenyl-beta-curcumene synthase family protein [Alkalihalobacillus sp. FSL W8-0930]